tara:strand:- start:3313 stop:3834 length:522 start_codon:yes stop_codon:yes gene_type:complete
MATFMERLEKAIKDFGRNFSDPVGLAQEMGAAEKDKPESEKRFAVAEYDMNKDIKKGMFYTKPMDISKSEGEQRRDDRDAAKKQQQKTLVTQATTDTSGGDTAAEKTDVELAADKMAAAANTTNQSVNVTEAVSEAQKPKKKGLKGGTIATSPRGLLSTDTSVLRPRRGLLAG